MARLDSVGVGVAAIASLAIVGCIIPEDDIRIRGAFQNPGAVRIVQSTPLSEQVNEACSEVDRRLLACPLVPDTQPFGLVELPGEPFCVCPERDDNHLFEFDIYAEDPDVDEDGQPSDSLFGVFLLDPPDASTFDPLPFVAYENYLDPTSPAVIAPPSTYSDAIERPSPNLRVWVIGRDTGMDLCNNDNNRKLEPGLHELRLIVTDRPWYVPVEVNDDGAPVRDADDVLVRTDAPPVIGVPDLPGGATYDTANMVFRCYGSDENAPPEGQSCNCAEVGTQ